MSDATEYYEQEIFSTKPEQATMRITIRDGIEGYENCQITIASWFCSQEGIVYSEGDIIRQTLLAILLKLKNKEVWVPKSLIEVHPIPKGLGEWR